MDRDGNRLVSHIGETDGTKAPGKELALEGVLRWLSLPSLGKIASH